MGRRLANVSHSVTIQENGDAAVSLENPFWESFRRIAKERDMTLGELLSEIKKTIDPEKTTLSSAVRVYILKHYQALAEEAAEPKQNEVEAHKARLKAQAHA